MASIFYRDAQGTLHELETEVGAGDASRPVHGIAGAALTALQAIVTGITALGGGTVTPRAGSKSGIGTSYGALSASSLPLLRGLYVKNDSASLQVLTLSLDGTNAGWTLSPGEVSVLIEVANVNALQIKSSAAGGLAYFMGS